MADQALDTRKIGTPSEVSESTYTSTTSTTLPAQERSSISEIIEPRSDNPREQELRGEVHKAEKWARKLAIEQGVVPSNYVAPRQEVEPESLTFPSGTTPDGGESFEEFSARSRAIINDRDVPPKTENSEPRVIEQTERTWFGEKMEEWGNSIFDQKNMDETGFFASSKYAFSRLLIGAGYTADALYEAYSFAKKLPDHSLSEMGDVFLNEFSSLRNPRFVPDKDIPAPDKSYELDPRPSDPNVLGGDEKTEIQRTVEDLKARWEDQNERIKKQKER